MAGLRMGAAGCALVLAVAASGDWPQFRGPDSAGLAPTAKPPLKWSQTENVAWKAPLPGRGLSGPVIIGKKLFLTASGGVGDTQLMTLAFDVDTGKELWRRSIRATGRVSCHPTMCMATPTPAADAKHVVSFYSCNDVACHDHEGNLLWLRGLNYDYPQASNSVGMSSSPLILNDTAVLQVENQGDSFAIGLNLETGETRWRLPRTAAASWASPVGLRTSKGTLLLLQSGDKLTAHDPGTGKQAWEFASRLGVIPSVTPAGGMLLVPANGVTALKAEVPSGAPEKVWVGDKGLASFTPSMLAMDGKVYAVNRTILACGDLATGKLLWQQRLSGSFSSTPVGADGKVYVFSEKGECFVIRPLEKEGEILSVNDLGEPILCTPAIDGDALYVRSDTKLYKLAAKDAK